MANRDLFSRLKRLFSTGAIVRNIGGKKLKVADTDNAQAILSNAMRDRFSRIHATSGYSSYNNQYGVNMAYQTQRITLFRDYDMMDNDPIINSALDIYADESTVRNEFGEILTIESDNSQIKEILHNLFYDILNIEFTLYMWIRNLVKYGDFFLFLEISPDYGIMNVMPLSVYDTERVEGEKPENPYYVRFQTMGGNGYKQSFDNYEIAHFRLVQDSNFMPYGKSMIEGARRIFRQLTLMEDAMMIHRIMRAPEKRVYKVDIGNIPPNEIDAYMQRLIDKAKKVPFVDPATGEYNLRYNMQNLLEDFWLPVRGKDSGTNIENLGGLEYNGIEDIEYLRNKLLAALKIPPAFIGDEEDVNGKATLAAEDVRFARTIERIQRIVTSELRKIAIVHLYAQGFTDAELVNFELTLTNPSTISEQEKINLWTQKAGLMAQFQPLNLVSQDWIYKNVLEMSEDDAQTERDKLVEDAKRLFRLTMIQQGASDPAKFGFPQDQSPEENAAQGMGPGGMGGPPGAKPGMGGPAGPGGPPGGGAPAPNMPKSVDELPTAEELGLEEETRGRPRKGSVYGQDSHVRGRDPLGFKARYTGKSRKPSPYKSRMAMESKRPQGLTQELKMMLGEAPRGKSKIISEQELKQINEIVESLDPTPNAEDSTDVIPTEPGDAGANIAESDTGTYMDESKVLENTEDSDNSN